VLAPFASATRIDFDNLTRYSFDAGYKQKHRGSIIREFAKNGGLGALKSELKEWKHELKNGWQGGSYVNAKNSSASNGTSVAGPDTFLVFAIGLALLAGWHVRHQRRLEECRSRRLTVRTCT
jgi:hypothetical protein